MIIKKNMSNHFAFCRILFLPIFLCLFINSGCSEKEIVAQNITKTDALRKVFKLEQSQIRSGRSTDWKVKEKKIVTDGSPLKVNFVSESVGWIASPKKIYRTLDGGNLWQTLNFEANFFFDSDSEPSNLENEDTKISFLQFVDTKTGWILVQKKGKESWVPEKKGFSIFNTTDGGLSWIKQYEAEQSQATMLRINSQKSLWVTGFKYVNDGKIHAKSLVICSLDGNVWNDVSERFNSASPNIKYQNNAALGVAFDRFETAKVIARNKQVMMTNNNGATWEESLNLTSDASEDNEPAAIRKFDINNLGQLWFIESETGREGTYARLNTVKTTGSEIRITTYSIGEFYLTDAINLDEDEFIVVGSDIAPDNLGGSSEKNKGLILYSNDNGANWSIVHKSRISSEFSSVSKISENKLFVTGQNGVGIILEKNNY